MRALLHDPPIIFLDEPTKGLDPIIAQKIRAFLQQYVHQEGKSLLLTSHILTEVDELASRVALIHRGTIPIIGTPNELKAAVGATDLIEIEKCALTETIQTQLSQLAPILFALDRKPGWLSLGVTDPIAGIEAIIHTLRQENIQTRFRQHTISLEDAFVHHIGELDEQFDH